MFSKDHCWAYRRSVGHRKLSPNLFQHLANGIKPEGQARLELPPIDDAYLLKRMSADQFKNTYCKNCTSNCKMKPSQPSQSVNHPVSKPIQPAPVQRVSNAVQPDNLPKVDTINKDYFDIPEDVGVAKVVGRVKNKDSNKLDFFCQAIVLDISDHYVSLLFFDGRDGREISDCNMEEVSLKMNFSGEIIDYGSVKISRVGDTNTFMLPLSFSGISSEEVIYRVKSVFQRICESVFR